MRQAAVKRETAETKISVSVNLDGTGKSTLNTQMGFFEHMLTLLARHSFCDLDICIQGDTQVDEHHSVEDCGIVLGPAIAAALGDKRGINRYGTFYIPMDEALVRCSLDLSGRGFLVYRAPEMVPLNSFDYQLAEEFFRALAVNAGITLHIEVLYGKNTHHMLEAMFKAFAHALRIAVEKDLRAENMIPSSKGVL